MNENQEPTATEPLFDYFPVGKMDATTIIGFTANDATTTSVPTTVDSTISWELNSGYAKFVIEG